MVAKEPRNTISPDGLRCHLIYFDRYLDVSPKFICKDECYIYTFFHNNLGNKLLKIINLDVMCLI